MEKKSLKKKILLCFFSTLISLFLLEISLRTLNLPPELNKDFQRKDIPWMEKNVDLNSAGYRDKEYPLAKEPGTLRIYALGDSYTYGWLVDNVEDTYPKILEKNYAEQNKKVEVINAGSPGFSLPEMTNRFKNEGKYYLPDVVALGINDDEANFSKTYSRPIDTNYPSLLKSSHLYQITLGNYYKNLAETANHNYALKIYTDSSSKEWENTSKELLKLKDEADKINAKIVIVLFPHIHPNHPDNSYDYKPFNEKYKKFARDNGFLLVDPLDNFLGFKDKSKLVVNPLDPHPTGAMNKIVAGSFIKQFDYDKFLKAHQSFTPLVKNAIIDQNNLSIGDYQSILEIASSREGYPWVLFETKNGNDIQNFPLKDKRYRNSKIYLDNLQTAKSFTHSALPGATILYYIYPKKPGEIFIPKNIYGYEVIALNHIYTLKIRDDGTVMGSYISPSEIVKNSEGINIHFYSDHNFHVFRLNLKVAVRQIDLSPQGSVEHIVKSFIVKATQPEKSKTVVLPFSSKVSSWPEFSGEDSKAYSYAFVNGKMTRVKEIEVKDEKITLKFDFEIEKDQEVELPVMAEYQLEPGETIQIDYE